MLRICWTLLCLLAASSCLAQSVVISEIMASNGETLLDEDGDTSDWIEVHNLTDDPISLSDWYLTDKPSDLTQWKFPATNLAANGFLVVFASDKDRSVAGAELHASFKLRADGDQVALVQPDGTTIEHQLSFPAQEEDISYGYGFTSAAAGPTIVIETEVPCTAHIPTSASDAAGWTLPAFDDAGWLSGNTGVGYETGSGYEGLIGLDVESVMHDENPSIYIRVPFVMGQALPASTLTLNMKYDDGFVAYINGFQAAASASAPASPQWNSESGNHADSAAVVFEEFNLDVHVAALQSGTNVLAIHGMNYDADSPDLIFMPKLEATFLDGDIDTSAVGLLSFPTPGSANAPIAYAGYVATPVTAPEHGFYDAPFQVTVSNVTPGATIRYTLDGSKPTESSTEYTGPVTISSTVNFRVRAFVDGWKPSYPWTETYIFVDDVVLQPEYEEIIDGDYGSDDGQEMEWGMNQGVVNATYYDASNQVVTVQDALKAIPTISLTTDYDNLFSPSAGIYVNAMQRWEVPASVEWIHPDGSEGFHINAGLRIRGGYSRHDRYEKHAFRLFFRQQYGEGKLRFPLFEDEGVDAFDKVDLRTAINYDWAHNSDTRNTFLRDVFCRDSAGAMGQDYTRSRYYHLYLNGFYWGLYMTEERPVADFGASYHGGDDDDYDAIKNTNWVDSDAPYYSIEATAGTTNAYTRLYDAAMAGFTDNADYLAVQGLDANGDPDPALEKLLDVDNMADYLLMIYYAGASDNGITKFLGGNRVLNNVFAFYDRVNPDGFKWVQHDCEHALDRSTGLDRTGPFTHSNYDLPHYFNAQTLHQKLSVNEEYRIKFADRVHKHFKNGGALVRTNCETRLDFRAAQIDRAIVANAARWGDTSLDRDNWVTAVANTRAFFARSGDRCDEVIGYLDADGLIPSIDPPEIQHAGGLVDEGTLVSIGGIYGTTYFTVDGGDPRAIGGAPAGTAYSESVAINRPVHLKARNRSATGEWSALSETVFWTPDIPLAVTELMYHAPGGNLHDFIEIRNVSGRPVSLRGYKIDKAIGYRFKNSAQSSLAPGEYLVAIKDIDGFSSVYGTNGIAIAGEYKGDFDNGGEEVQLEFMNHDLIEFSYSDARNWPQAADGGGHSLVPLDAAMAEEERGSLDYGGNWRASTELHGSPGATDPAVTPTVVLNEIVAHTDTGQPAPFDSNDQIELFNPTASAAPLDGWYLSDDLDDRTKWPIPPGTVVPAQGFIFFDEDDFHPGRTNGFGLDKAGEQVILSTPTHVADAIRFKGQDNGVSLGRYPDGAADWLRTLPTPGTPNQLEAASIRIRALMYNPPIPSGYTHGDMLEYIQLENQGAGTVAFQTAAGAWRIDGGVSYTFPSGLTLSAGEQLWLVSFDPVTEPTLLNLFATTYGLNPAQETILGPYNGQLSNRGERVAVERPQESDDPLDPSDISWIVVDEVFYFDQAPWPTGADGTGFPLLRTGVASWGAPTATDTDADLLPDSWEMAYFGTLDYGNMDWDYDQFTNYEEYIAGTDPTNAISRFQIADAGAPSISWSAVPGRRYTVYWSNDLLQPFEAIATGLTGGSYTDQPHSAVSPNYYRISVEME